MKTIRTLLIFLILSSCTASRYYLADSGDDKEFLSDMIAEMSKKGLITNKPIVVLDGVPLRYDIELKEERLQISKDDIEHVELLKSDVSIRIYGEYGEAGVILITTKSNSEQEIEKPSS